MLESSGERIEDCAVGLDASGMSAQLMTGAIRTRRLGGEQDSDERTGWG